MEKSEQQESEEANHVLPTVKKPSDECMLMLESSLVRDLSQDLVLLVVSVSSHASSLG